MAKPRLFNNGPNQSEGAGDRAYESAEEGEGKGTDRDGGEGKERAAHEPSLPAEPPAGIERAIRPERGERRRKRLPRGRKMADKETERPRGGPR